MPSTMTLPTQRQTFWSDFNLFKLKTKSLYIYTWDFKICAARCVHFYSYGSNLPFNPANVHEGFTFLSLRAVTMYKQLESDQTHHGTLSRLPGQIRCHTTVERTKKNINVEKKSNSSHNWILHRLPWWLDIFFKSHNLILGIQRRSKEPATNKISCLFVTVQSLFKLTSLGICNHWAPLFHQTTKCEMWYKG